MEKESVKKFDLEAAFKALDEIEIPQTKGIKANRVDLKERFGHKPATETLVEDYYDVSSTEDLEEAKDERDAEVAQAKLARIEKIVDLDAETADDLLPSYVGKVIMQCPQCMTLFYKNPEDIEHSEENPDIVNLNEPCQHCGNTSGYTLIGKVDSVGSDEADKYEETPADENELDLDFDAGTEEVDAEGTGEGAEEMSNEETSDEELDLDLNLDEVPEEEPEEEKKEESLNLSKETSENETEHKSENLTLNEEAADESLNTSEVQKEAEEGSELKTENESENLTLNEEVDKDLDKKLKAHNDYIAYLQQMIKQEEEALKKAENDEIKAAIQRRLDAFNADLEAALPEAVKEEAPVEEVPAEEPVEEAPVEEEPKAEEEAPVEEALTEKTEECKVVLSDKPEKEVFAGSKEDCEKIIEQNKETNTAKEHGLEIVEPAVDESLNKSEEVSENETEEKSDNLTLNEGAEAEIDSIIASWGLNESLTEEGNLDRLLDSDEFKTPVSEEEIDAAREDVKEEGLEECNKQKLTEEPDPEVSAIIDSWEDAPVEEGYTGNPAERTTHLEYTDDNPADGKAVLPDNIEKQLTEDAECKDGECEKPLEECGENCEEPLKEEDEVPAEEEAPVEEPVEAPVAEEPVIPENSEEVSFTTEEVKEVATDVAQAVYAPVEDEEEAEKQAEEIAEVVEEKVNAAIEEKVEEANEGEAEEPVESEEAPVEAEEPEFNEDDIDELDECSLNKHIDEYLHEVYSNVKSYETTGCELKEGKLIVEGKISFNSGKEKLTMFEFLPAYCEGKLFFEGYNKDFSEDKAFTLNCSINESKTLITESFGYKYKINENLVEGLK